MLTIELNPDCRPDIRIIGAERTPVVVIDDPVLSVDALRAYALEQATFGPDSQFAYPGIRAGTPPEYSRVLAPHLAGLLRHLYSIPAAYDYQLFHEVFSLVTEKPEDLMPLQRIPHTDTRQPFYFATVHYLNEGDFSGTGFFRHKPTSYERISEERYPRLIQAGNVHMEAHGLPPMKYINESDDHFELMAQVDYRPNRLVMYPGNLLHSGLIRPELDLRDDPASGRLTANMFLYFQARQDAPRRRHA